MAGPLEIGFTAPLHVREERISSRVDPFRLVYVSDIHLRFRRSQRLVSQVVHAVGRCDANAVLLGGDLVDSLSELENLRVMVKQLAHFAPVLAVAGNHDRRVGAAQVRGAVLNGGGRWIDDDIVSLQDQSRVVSVFGPGFAGQPTGDVQVLCAHNPRIWKQSKLAGYDLVLSGHLHGCQFVAFEFRGRLYPGAVFYPYNYLSHQVGGTRLVVSRGVSDLLPVRLKCPREVILCYV